MYTTKDLIENYTQQTIESSMDNFVIITIKAVQNYIENFCGDRIFGKRIFEKPSLKKGEEESDSIRYFDGNGERKIFIGEAVEISGFELDGITMIKDEDYFLKPYNAVDMDIPFEFIELVQPNRNMNSRSNARFDITVDQRNVKVTGKFRYSNCVPSDIKLIATQLASAFVLSALDDGIKSETFDDYRVDYGDVSKKAEEVGADKILLNYKRQIPKQNAGIRLAE